jgi:GntR family transcriptional regulator / MocR family aminotransferase
MSTSLELLIRLERGGGEALHHQLEQQLREAIRSGRLGAHAALPSTRGLAAQLEVARGVVVEAYEQLIAEGYLVSRPGGRTRVAPIPVAPQRTTDPLPPVAFDIDLRPGRPEVTQFPRAA